jgi:Ca2+/Na+ antiporter
MYNKSGFNTFMSSVRSACL